MFSAKYCSVTTCLRISKLVLHQGGLETKAPVLRRPKIVTILVHTSGLTPQIPPWTVSLKHDGTDGTDGTDGPVKLVNTDGTAIERADGTANTGANYQIITY